MKRMKKTLCLAVAILLMITSVPVTDLTDIGFGITASALSENGKCGADATYTFDSATGKLAIEGSGKIYGEAFYKNYEIKEVVIGYGITGIGVDAFGGCNSLISVEIPDSVTTIGKFAFEHCNSLISVEIPDSVTTIDGSAFFSCDILTSVEIGDSVTTIGVDTFFECGSLTSVEIGDSVTNIDNNAFYGCWSLTRVKIPDSVITIDNCAFENCYRLTSVEIGNGLTSIGQAVFGSCSNLKDVYYNGSEEEWKKIDISPNNTYLDNATIHFNETMPADCTHNTTYTLIERVDPTCTTDGHYRYYKCVCGAFFNRLVEDQLSEQIADINTFGVMPALGHSWTEATCTEAKHCTRTGCTATEGTALGHTGGTATCLTAAKCTRCAQFYGDKANHTYATTYTVDVEPICTAEGSKSKHCTTTGCTAKTDVIAIAKTGHKYDKIKADGKCTVCTAVCTHNQNPLVAIPEVKATCTTEGSKNGYYCTDCGKVVIEPKKVDKLGHDIEVIGGVEPTCTSAGKSDGKRCKREGCDYKVDQVVLDALGHFWGTTKVVIKEATCTENGSKATVCTRPYCKAIKEGTIEEIAMKAHDYKAKAVTKEATCETAGEKAKVCKNCTAKTDIEVIPTLGHDMSEFEVTTQPTCTAEGIKSSKCSRCSRTITETLPANGHDFVVTKGIAPTCSTAGKSDGKRCKREGCDYKVDQVVLDALGHFWGTTKVVIKEATCTENGSKALVCTRSGCKAIKEGTIEEIPRYDHYWTATKVIIKEATCEKAGEKGVLCKACKTIKEGSIEAIPFLGHNELIRSNGDGKHTIFCTRAGCGFSEESECSTTSHICGQIPVCDICKKQFGTVFGHIIEMIKDMPATCTQDGEIEYACEYCDYGYTERLDALGHTYPDNWSTILEPDCQSKGASIKVCLNCNNVISQTLPKTGHADLDGDNKCDTCDKTIAVVEPEKEPEEKPCECDCHAGGIKAFFFKFLNFFAKLFDKSKRVCACGTAH